MNIETGRLEEQQKITELEKAKFVPVPDHMIEKLQELETDAERLEEALNDSEMKTAIFAARNAMGQSQFLDTNHVGSSRADKKKKNKRQRVARRRNRQ